MKRQFCLAILIVFLCIFLCACDPSGSTDSTVNGAMIEVKDKDGSLSGYERRFYNDNGDVTRLDVYDADQTYLYYILYEYDDNNRLFTQTRYKSEGFAEHRYIYTYDDDGNLTEKALEHPHGEAEVWRYDADGNEVERLYYDIDEKLIKSEKLENGKWVTYDPNGKIIN